MTDTRDSTPFGLILLLWGAGLGAAGQYAKVSVVFDHLPQHYPQSDVVLGLIVSIVGFVGIGLGVVVGDFVGRIGYRRALLWSLWLGAALSMAQALMPPLWLMLALRMLEGLSHLGMVVAIPTLIAQISATRHRGFTLTLWSTFFSVGFTLLVWLGLPLVAAGGISALFVAHGVWMAAFAVILGLWLVPMQSASPSEPGPKPGVIARHIAVYHSPFVAAPAIGWAFYTFGFLAVLTLIPPFIAEESRALVVGAMPLIAIAVSMTLGVWLLRYLSAIQVVMLGFASVVVSLAWLTLAEGVPVACFAFAAALGLVQGASFAAVPQLNTIPADQARANGAMAQMGNIGNTSGTPVLAMVLASGGYVGMMSAACVVMAGGLVAHLLLARARSSRPDRRALL